MKTSWFLVGALIVLGLAAALSGCVEDREVQFSGVDYVVCTKSHHITNPDCYSPEKRPVQKHEKQESCDNFPTVIACTEWIVSGGHGICGSGLNCLGGIK